MGQLPSKWEEKHRELSERARMLLLRRSAAPVDAEMIARAALDYTGNGAPELAAALVESAFLVSRADRALERTEVATLGKLLTALVGHDSDRSELAGVAYELERLHRDQGHEARIAAIGSAVQTPDEGMEVLRFAALSALSDEKLAPAEVDTLRALAAAFGVSREDCDRLVRDVEARATIPPPPAFE
jgi:hypothetical protein